MSDWLCLSAKDMYKKSAEGTYRSKEPKETTACVFGLSYRFSITAKWLDPESAIGKTL
jgi:hypothetical protein